MNIADNIKDQALQKMLQEMTGKHSEEIDAIHNWLCDHIDNEGLAEGILQPGKSIKGSYDHCAKEARRANKQMVKDDVVFGWVETYFKTKEEPKPEPAATKPVKPAKPAELTEEQKASEKKRKAESARLAKEQKLAAEKAAQKAEAERIAKEEAKLRKRQGVDANQASIFDFGLDVEEARVEEKPAKPAGSVCRVCGCTDNQACQDGCYWVEKDLCSKCYEELTASVDVDCECSEDDLEDDQDIDEEQDEE